MNDVNIFVKECVCVWNRKRNAYIKMKLICPVANDFVFSCLVSELILVDLIAPRCISIFIEEHWIPSYA